jgi:hypothetical protein
VWSTEPTYLGQMRYAVSQLEIREKQKCVHILSVHGWQMYKQNEEYEAHIWYFITSCFSFLQVNVSIRVLLKTAIVTLLVKRNSSIFMGPEGSFSCSQQTVADPYLEEYVSSPHNHTLLFNIHCNIILPSMFRFSSRYLPFRFLDENYSCISPLS